MAETVTVAVAGLGTIAQTIHLPLLERLGDRFRIGAVADASPALLHRLGERYRIPESERYPSTEEMLEGTDCDAVLLLTPGSHVPPAAAALRRGLAVLAEKPLGYAHAELASLEGLVEGDTTPGAPDPASGSGAGPGSGAGSGSGPGSGSGSGRLMVGYMKQYDPAARRLARRVADAGGPAAIHALDVTVLHPSGSSQLDFARLPAPAGDIPADATVAVTKPLREALAAALGPTPSEPIEQLYSITLNSICHELSLIRLLSGPPVTVDHAALWPAPGAAADDPPSVELSGTLPGGGRYGIRWLYQPDYPVYRETVTVHHATGSGRLVFPSPYLLNAPTVLTETDGRSETESRTEHRSPVGGFEAQLLAFHALVTDGTPPLSGVREAAADITFAQQAVRRLAAGHDLDLSGEAAHA